MNRLRQFIFTGATIPKMVFNSPGNDAMQTINEWFLGGI
jgi:superfamily II DNA/RNA helicase